MSRTFFLQGPAGRLEAIRNDPIGKPNGSGAVVCHPHPLYGGTMENKVVFRMAKGLRETGCATLRFNFRGAGRSEGNHDRGRGEREDVRAALDYMADRHDPLLLAGFSFGAWCGLDVGVADPRVKTLIGVGLPLEMYDFSFLSKTEKPLLLIQAEQDEFGPGPVFQEFVESLNPETTTHHVIPNVGHLFQGKEKEVQEKVRTWSGGNGRVTLSGSVTD